MPENYFDARIAQTYEAKWPELFDPGAIDPVVGFLASLAGSGAALELGIGTGAWRYRSAGAASGCTGSNYRPTWPRNCARSQARTASG